MTFSELNKKLIALSISKKTDEKLDRINEYLKIKIDGLIEEISLTLNKLF